MFFLLSLILTVNVITPTFADHQIPDNGAYFATEDWSDCFRFIGRQAYTVCSSPYLIPSNMITFFNIFIRRFEPCRGMY